MTRNRTVDPSHVETDEVERCRQVRRQIERRYKTLDGLCEHLMRLDRDRSRRKAATRRARRDK